MAVSTATQHTTDGAFSEASFEQRLASRREPPWLVDLRRSAWTAFGDLPWPRRQGEEWMRTDIRGLRLGDYALAAPNDDVATAAPRGLLAEGVQLGGAAACVDGRCVRSELNEEARRQGVLFGSIAQFAEEHSELLRDRLFQSAFRSDYDKFSALHAAFAGDGALLYVPRGVRIEQPLHLVSAVSDGGSDLGHTFVLLEEGAEATLLAETTSLAGEGRGFHCGGVELLVGANASLRFVDLQNWGERFWHFTHQKAIVERDGRLQWTIGALGAHLAKVNQHVALVGEGAEAQVNGVMFTEKRQHLSYHTLQHHVAPHCMSDLLYEGALQDKSRTVWRGMIKVDPGAQKTNGYQRNDNLLLSEGARADSIPGLEIEADDVRCTHASTSGKVDEEMIFYAQCRGLTRKEAVRMIVAGFFQKVFDRVTIDSVRDALGEAIGRRIREYA